jgi:hypothetical protein
VSDNLRQRLRAADPVPRATPVEPADSPGTRALVEAIMQTRPDIPPTAGTSPTAAEPRRRPRWLPAVAAAAGVAAIAGGGALIAANRADPPTSVDALELRLPDNTTMGMCIPFSVDQLAEMSPAFAGTATDVTGDTVVLRVDRWYGGGDASEVVLVAPDPDTISLAGGIEFQEGERYLITAAEGTVNYCGFSGEATPELEAAFEQAF